MSDIVRKFASEEDGGRDVGSFDELLEAIQEWFTYDQMEESPFPSKEPPLDAARRWFQERLRLSVEGTNRFRMTCPGCSAEVAFETNFLHTRPMFDYEYWQFCPTCSAALEDDGDDE